MNEKIRSIVRTYARLRADIDGLKDGDDLFAAGMTSHAAVNVMLGLEREFDVEFPNRMLRRQVFESVTAIAQALEELMKERGDGR
jgi:acyl carrier protein